MTPARALLAAAERCVSRGDTARASFFLARALDWEVAIPHAFEIIGLIELDSKAWGAAETSFRHALDGKRFTPRAYCGLGIALREQGSIEHARTSFEYAIRVAGGQKCPWRNRAVAELTRLEVRRALESEESRRDWRTVG